jgi:hypothetical protein
LMKVRNKAELSSCCLTRFRVFGVRAALGAKLLQA